nr:ankyrin repeat-containing protein NPR4-like [Ziziphus jujuba var. spinosa]
MDKTVFEAAASGDQRLIERLIRLGDVDPNQQWQRDIDPNQVVTPHNNTILHIAVRFNQQDITQRVSRLCPQLLVRTNADGDSPLHIAAKIGNREIVQRLIGGFRDVEIRRAALRMKNLKEEDTALHVAVKNGHFGVVQLLTQNDPELLNLVNKANESPLFLAVEGSFLDIARHILNFGEASCHGFNGMNALHTAVVRAHHAGMLECQASELSLERIRRLLSNFYLYAGDHCINTLRNQTHPQTYRDIMDLLLQREGLATQQDQLFGWTPLHCAAHVGNQEATKLLLHSFPTRIAYLRDNQGMSALHIAAKQGHVNVMEEIIDRSPDACESIDNRGSNPLHVAIANAKLNVVRFILNEPRLDSLINAADNEGNTPLHLAARSDRRSIITILVNDSRVNKKAQNLIYQMPIDFILDNPNLGEFYKSMIVRKLDKPGGRASLRSLVNRINSHEIGTNTEVGHENNESRSHRLKNILNIHILVASLIATVTFAAGFAMPGGYEQDLSSTKGMAMLSNKTSFKVFVIADSIAFCCSSVSVFIQFWGSLEHNYHLLLRFTRVAATLTYISSLGMAVAFTSAIHAVIPHSTMLAYYTIVSGICCALAYIFGFL